MSRILCVVNGGMGDEILTLPAIRFLHKELGPQNFEIRLGGWKLRHELYTLLAGCPLDLKSLETLWRMPNRSISKLHFDWILDFDFTSQPRGIPKKLIPAKGYLCFPRPSSQYHDFIIVEPKSYLFSHRCIELILRWMELNAISTGCNINLTTVFEFYRFAVPAIDARVSSRNDRKIFSGRTKPRLAVSPGGYNPPHKRWPAERFAEVIWHAVNHGIDVFVLGSKVEMKLAQHLYSLISARPEEERNRATGDLIFLTGSKIVELPSVLQQMQLHLTNDNGIAHIAGALNLSQIVLYLGSDSVHRTLGTNDTALFSNDRSSMESIQTSVVIEHLTRLFQLPVIG